MPCSYRGPRPSLAGRARLWRGGLAGLLSLVFLLSTIRLAAAQPRPADSQTIEQQAVEHFERSKRLYQEGRYEESLAELRSAHRLVPHKDLLISIARLEDKLKQKRKALASYREYLAQNPAAPERPKIESRIRRLKAELDEEDRRALAARQPPPQPVKPPQPVEQPRSLGRRIGVVPIVVFVAGAVLLIAGGAVNGQAVSLARFKTADHPDRLRAEELQPVAFGLYGAGGGLVLAGVTWAGINLVRTRSNGTSSRQAGLRLRPSASTTGLGLSLDARF